MPLSLGTLTFTGIPGTIIPAGTSVEVTTGRSTVFHPDYGSNFQHVEVTRLVTAKDAVVQMDSTVTVDVVDPIPWEVRRILQAIFRAKA